VPLPQLDAQFSRLDLSQLLAPLQLPAPAPQTDLTGTATVQLSEDQPLVLQLEARNAAPGAWDRQRLPLRELALVLRGQGGAWQIEQARLDLAAGERTPAGRITASGRVDGVSDGQLAAVNGELQLVLDGVRPDLLDRRGPPMLLSGPITLRHTAAAASSPTGGSAAPFGTLGFDARLEGSLQGVTRARSPRPLQGAVQLVARGQATPQSLQLDTLKASAGRATLEASGLLRRQAASGWQSDGQLALEQFDPSLWLPGDPAAAWRRARNELHGKAQWQLQLAGPLEAASLLRSARGQIGAEFTDSHLAGQPLALTLQARGDAGPLELSADLQAGGNRAALTATLRAPGAAAGPEQLTLRIDAPALARLSTVAELLGVGPLAGQLKTEARMEGALGARSFGRGGALGTRGSLQAESLQVGKLHVDAASGDWDATLPGSSAPAATAPGLAAVGQALLRAQFELRQARVPGLVIPSASLQLGGSLADHHASLKATLRQPPTADARQIERAAEPAPLSLEASLTGQWTAGADGAVNHWRVQLPSVLLQPMPGSMTGALAALALRGDTIVKNGGPPKPAARPLLQASDLSFDLYHGADRLRLEARPGAVNVLDTALLRWRSARWEQDGSAPPQLTLDAEVEPVQVADLLRRLQPDFGWGGDLRVGAKLTLRSSPSVSARLEIARTGGDLQVSEFGIVQTLGLTEARIDVSAESGVWRTTQQIAGSNLGRLRGEQTARTGAEQLWPDAQAPIEGQLSAKVENLGTWGAWLPAGWRLAGQLDAALRIAGRMGAPELIGELTGRRLGVRNSLEGVLLTDGELDARFEGDTARLTTLRFKAGSGSIALSGDAQLGDRPKLLLELKAEQATLLGRVDRRVVASGEASLRGGAERLALNGSVRIDQALIDISRSDAPSLGDDVTVRREADRATIERADAAAARPRAQKVDVDLAVNLGPRFVLRGRGLDTRLAGDLRLTAPGGRLNARGEIRAERGTYDAYGQKLEIERGVITFVGNLENPQLDIEAVRPRSDVRVGVAVSGTVQSPRIRLFSDPELPPTEKLALLVTGRSYDSLGGSDTALLQRAALALLAGDGSDGTNLDVTRLLKLDELSMRQTEGAVPDTVVTVGKEISDRVYVGYERGLNAAVGNWQVIYRVGQRFRLRAQSGDDPALDLIWLFRWN
jgi:translocation and assembly module TamB